MANCAPTTIRRSSKKSGFHKLAIQISELEGKKINLSVAQIKEVIRCMKDVMCQMPQNELMNLIEKLITR